jgi:ribosomal protein S18 acetylase RimI-like enzyme
VTPRHPLDNPARSALLGPHAALAERYGQALRYPADISPFGALPDEPGEASWRDAATLVGPGGILVLPVVDVTAPPDWQVLREFPSLQFTGEGVAAAADGEAAALGTDDVPEMLDLVARTQPGPFEPRTITLGGYLGIRREGRLVAMAGQRLRAPGWTEISAVCTDTAYRGQGLAARLVRAVQADIQARGETSFLHVMVQNTGAIALYAALGFRLRRPAMFRVTRAPAG